VTVVTIHVDDVNDHSPTFVFPNAVNHTVHVTSSAVTATGRGYLLVAVCQAVDSDDGPNARVTYEITNVSSTSAAASLDQFRIGRTSGRLTMRVGTVSGSGGSENATFVIAVRARDDGWPPLSTSATLYVVVVNTPMVFDDRAWDDWSEPGASTTHPKYRLDHRCKKMFLYFLLKFKKNMFVCFLFFMLFLCFFKCRVFVVVKITNMTHFSRAKTPFPGQSECFVAVLLTLCDSL